MKYIKVYTHIYLDLFMETNRTTQPSGQIKSLSVAEIYQARQQKSVTILNKLNSYPNWTNGYERYASGHHF